MASALHTKINSYAIERGFEFSETYSTSPTRTGTNTGTSAYSLQGTAPTFIPEEGPSGGAGCWRFTASTFGSSSTRFYTLATSERNLYLNDKDWIFNFWVKFSALPNTNIAQSLVVFSSATDGHGFTLYLTGSTNTSGGFTGSKFMVQTGSTTITQNFSTVNIVANKWYMVSVKRTAPTQANNYKFYVNGVQNLNWTNLEEPNSSSISFGSQTAVQGGAIIFYDISNYALAATSVLTDTALQEIYAVGSFGYEKGLEDLGITPTLWYKFNNNAALDIISNYGTNTTALDLSSTPTYINYPDGKSKGAINLTPFSGYDIAASSNYGLTNTIAFWFKRPSPPASQLQWMYTFFNTDNKIDTADKAGINTDGTIRFAPTINGQALSALISTTNICDNQWHHVVITRNGVNAKLYIDGSLQSSTSSWNAFGISTTSNFQPFSGLGNYFDDYTYFATNELSAAQVAALYASTVSATNINITGTAGMVADSTFPMPTVTAQSSVSVTYNSEAFGGNLNSATMVGAMPSIGVNLDAPGVSTASSDFVFPVISTVSNVEYFGTVMTASATDVMPTVSTQKYVDYFAVPATASALFSSNVYYGETLQDTSYALVLRSIGATTNTSANGGFSIGATRDNNIVSQTSSLAIKANAGFPIFSKVVKAKFDPTHVGVATAGDYSPSNYFNVYVFTANPSTTFDTMNFGNLPAKEFVFTTRLVDDGSANQFYLDLTPVFADSRAATYGVYIELNTETVGGSGSGTYYDRTEWTGSNLQNHLLYVLTSDIVNKNINADIITANAEFAMPAVDTQKYVNIQDGVAIATADAVHPAISAEQSNTYTSGTLDASANAVQPAFNATVEYTSDHLEAFANISNPTLDITGVVNYSATSAIANALFHMPQTNIGENNSADHMNASALMVNPLLVINTSVAPMVATLSGTMPDPTIGTQLLGTIFASPMTGSALMTVLANDSSLTSDIWYNRLYQQDYVSLANEGFVGFMLPYYLSNTGNLVTGSTIRHSGYEPSGPFYATALANLNTNLTPAPIATQGFYDNWNRRSINLNNISYRWRDPLAGSETVIRSVDRGYTMEAMIKTSKSNQVLFIGQNGYTFTANIIGLKDGKVYIKQSIDNTLFVTDSRINNTTKTTTLMQATNTNLADGQWHHLIIQFGYDGRHQIWIDGELELQRYGYTTMLPNIIGYNSADSALSSSFEISGFAIQSQQFLLEKDVQLNYFAAINYAPIEVEPMTASAAITQDTTARGNRGRALMLYFWSTYGIGSNNYAGGSGSVPAASLQRNTSFDQGPDYFDYDTGPNLSTWELEGTGTQQWNGWDIFPIDVQGIYASSVVNPASYKNLTTATYYTGQNPISWKQAEGFFDETTDNRRYIDLMKDIPNLEDYDAIFFRNYPDQGMELESFSRFESVDSYFKLQEKTLFEDFIKSLREAVDTGISLLVTNPQLAIDLGIIDRVEIVPDLSTQIASRNDAYAQAKIEDTAGAKFPVNTDAGSENTLFYYADTYKNNRHRLVNTVEGLTDIPGYIWKETVYYNNDGAVDFAGNDRWWNKYDYHTSIPVGEDFLIATHNNRINTVSYQAVPFANIKAGKPMTAFATTINQNGVDISNPYVNYATSIVVEPGDNLNGRQVGGKIFVSFTETLQKVGDYDVPKEYGQIDLRTDSAINFAYNQGAITLAKRNALLADSENFDRQLEAGTINQTEYNKLTYWNDNGNNIISAINYGNTEEVVAEGNPSATGERPSTLNKYTLRPNEKTVQNFSTSGPWFTLSWGYTSDRVNVWVPSINVRAFNWLYNREFLEGRNQDHTAQTATAVMVNPSVSANKENSVSVQPMLANATITQGDYSDSRNVLALPLEANATITQFVRNINALPMTASAILRTQIAVLTSAIDEVVLYIYHDDPVLYLREEVIK